MKMKTAKPLFSGSHEAAGRKLLFFSHWELRSLPKTLETEAHSQQYIYD